MPLGDWLKNWSGEQPPEKPENVVVAESLLMELDYHMKEAYERWKQEQQENKRKMSGGVDYSWLATPTEKPYDMPQLDRLELEDLCMKVKPDECGRVILSFRDCLVREPEQQEVPRILRAVIHQVLDGRAKEETMPEWVMRSLTSLSKYRPNPRITPIDSDSPDVERSGKDARKKSSVASVSTVSTEGELKCDVKYDSVDELPV